MTAGGSRQKMAQKCLVDTNCPKMILIQESVGKGDSVTTHLKKFLVNCYLSKLDANGNSGGVVTQWNQNVSLLNSFS